MRRLYTCVFVLIIWSSTSALAGGDIFKWVDENGNLHATQILADVPEPYYSMYASELRRRQESKQGQAPAPPAVEEAPSAPRPTQVKGVASENEARQKRWRELVARARADLTAATAALEAADQAVLQAGANPVLRHTPAVQAKLAELATERQAALAAVEAARRQLLEDLPRQARKEGVPPRWFD